MKLKIAEALKEGISEGFSKKGIALMAILAPFNFSNFYISSALSVQLMETESLYTGSIINALTSLSPAVLGSLLLLNFLLLVYIYLVSIRTMEHEVNFIPIDFMERDIASAALNLIAGGIIFTVLMSVGFVLLIVPGLFVASTLVYFAFFIAIEDENFLSALKSSWELTENNRFRTFALLFSLVALALLAQFILGVAFMIITLTTGGYEAVIGQAFNLGYRALIQSVTGSVMTITSLGVFANAYNQLRK